MIRLGILTVRQEKAGFLTKLRNMLRIKEQFRTQAEFVVAELAWTEEELRRLPAWLREWLYRKSRRFLLKQDCQGVAPDRLAEEAFFLSPMDASGFYLPIPPGAFKRCLADLMPDNAGKVWIKTESVKAAEELLDILCPGCKAFAFCTDDTCGAEKLSEKICNDYGFYPQVREKTCPVPISAFWIDLDEGAVGIGRSVIADAMEFMFDLKGYQIAQGHYWSNVDLPVSELSFVSWCRGKKRLTIG